MKSSRNYNRIVKSEESEVVKSKKMKSNENEVSNKKKNKNLIDFNVNDSNRKVKNKLKRIYAPADSDEEVFWVEKQAQ